MAKKKSKKQAPPKISPKNYIRTRARALPLAECLVNKDWKIIGLANIIVCRQHKSGNYTVGIYLVDMFCLGVKDTTYRFNASLDEYEKIKEGLPLKAISYNEAHNMIYGAVAYAEDLGIDPHPDFELTQYIIEEDTEDIPLIKYEFGKNGKPFLVVSSRKEESKYVSILNKNLGEGNFDFLLQLHDGADVMDYGEEEDGYYFDREDE